MRPDRPPAPSIDLREARVRFVASLLWMFLLGVIGLGAVSWADVAVRAALAVWERIP